MKKRALSLLLTLSMLLSLFPISAQATEPSPQPIPAEFASIHFSNNNNEQPLESTMNCGIGDEQSAVFYYDNGGTKTVIEDISSFGGSAKDHLHIEKMENRVSNKGNPIYLLTPNAPMKDEELLINTSDGQQYSIPVSATLPRFGFYTDTTVSPDNLLPGKTFHYDDTNRTFYYLASEENVIIKDVNLTGKAAEILSASLVNDYQVKLQVKGGVTESTHLDRVEFLVGGKNDPNDCYSHYEFLEVVNTAPSVQIRHVNYPNDTPTEEGGFDAHLAVGLTFEQDVTFYYGTASDAQPLKNVSVSKKNNSQLIDVEEGTKKTTDGNQVFRIFGNSLGDAVLKVTGTYTDSNQQDVTAAYELPVSVILPEFALYTSQKFTADSLLENREYTPNTNATFWLLTREGFPNLTQNDIKVETYLGNVSCTPAQRDNSNIYDVMVTIPAGTTGDVEFNITINNGRNSHIRLNDSTQGGNQGGDQGDGDQGDGDQGDNSPVQFRWVWDDQGNLVENEHINSHWDFVLAAEELLTPYYYNGSKSLPLKDVSVQVADKTVLTVDHTQKSTTDQNPVLRIIAKNLGSTTLTLTGTYTDGNNTSVTVTYEIPVNVSLPEFALYTKQNFTEAALMKDRTFTSGQSTTLWLLTERGFRDAEILDMSVSKGSLSYELAERDNTGYYDVKLTIPASVYGDVEFFFKLRDHESAHSSRVWENHFQLRSSSMRYKWVEYRDGSPVRENDYLESQWGFGLGNEENIALYYGTDSNAKHFTSISSVTVIPDSNNPGVITATNTQQTINGHAIIRLIANKLGNATLSVTGTLSGQNTPATYNVPVSVVLPEFALYTSRDFSADSLLKNWTYTPGLETEVWLLSKDGFLNADITQWEVFSGTIQKKLVRRGTSDAFDIKLTIPANVLGDIEFHIELVTQDNNTRQYWRNTFLLRDISDASIRDNGNRPSEIDGFSLKQIDEKGTFGPHMGYLYQTQNTTKTYAVFMDGQQIKNYAVNPNTYMGDNGEPQMTAVVDEDTGLMTVTMTSDYFYATGTTSLTITEGDRSATFTPQVPTPTYHRFIYNGEIYALTLGLVEPGGDIRWGGGFGEGVLPHQMGSIAGQRTRTVAVTVFKNPDTDREAEAPEIAKKLFEHVEFFIGLDENRLFSFSSSPYEKNGAVCMDVLMDSKAATGTIAANVRLKGFDEMFHMEIMGMREVYQTQIVDCAELGLDTMAEVQNYLDTMPAPNTDTYAEIVLAPGTYTGVLEYNRGFSNVLLRGAVDENGIPLTTINGGIRINTKMADIRALRFKATNDVKIGISGTNGGYAESIDHCSFEGYDIAVLADDNGMTYPVTDNLFLNNKIGLKVNYVADTGFHYNRTAVAHSSFVGNETAILFESVSSYSPYYYRVTYSDFINNEQDIVSHVPEYKGPFYCYGNFFGTYETHNNKPSVDDKYKRHNANEGNVESAVGYKRPLGVAHDHMRWYGYGEVLDYIQPDALMSVDPSVASARILNDDAGSLLLDGSTFTDRSAELTLDVVNAEGQTFGSWNFSADESLQAMLVQYSLARSTPDGFNAGLDIWYHNDSDGREYMEVFVADNAATNAVLQEHQPTLTIPTVFLGAVVQFNGQTIPSSMVSGNVTFTVAESGTYTIYPSDTPGVGLFCRVLDYDHDREGYFLSDEYPLNDWTISMAPYVDMAAIAFFYSDGQTVTPVEITIDRTTGYDYVPIPQDANGDAVVGWYEMSPYDFTTSAAECTVNGQTYRIRLETRMPWLAFYSEKEMQEETFRMYTLMDENPNAETDGYKYCTTLHINSPNDDTFDWTEYYTFSATQKQYNAYGREIGEAPVSAADFKAEVIGIDANGYMTVTLYSNVGDLLVWLEGYASAVDMANNKRSFGTYVNLLTPDEDSTLFINLNTGFAAANFLPRHLFEQVAAREAGITIGSNKYPGSVHYDQDAAKNIMALLNNSSNALCLVMDHAPGTAPQDQAIDRYASKNKDIVKVVTLDMLLGNVAQHELNGTATITYACDLNVPNGSKVDIYYLDDNNTVLEKIEGTYANGLLTFQTTHFSDFAVTVDGTASSGGESGVAKPSGGGSGGASADSESTVVPNVTSPTVSTEKTENSDGSTTVTETKKDGTVVETTTNADGSTTVSASKSETVTDKTTGETTTTTATNTTTTTATGEKVTEEKVEETVKKADGTEVTTSTTQTKSSDGSKSTTTVDETGKVEAEVTVSSTAVSNADKADAPVALPMPAVEATKSTETAATVSVNIPASADSVKVEIPVAEVTPGTVVVLVAADGTETIVPTTALTENGVAVEVEGDVTVKVVDNSKDFGDVAENYALSDSIDFVSARGLFQGTSATTFHPHADTTRGQLMTVLARAAGADTTGTPIQKGMEWAKEMGISDGTNAGGSVTRQQLATMLWRLAGCPVPANSELTGTDADQVAAYAKDAMAWCAEMGIMNGYADGSLGATKNASRAHVAAFVERYINAVHG